MAFVLQRLEPLTPPPILHQYLHTARVGLFFELSGIPFILMGAYITVGRFFLDSRQRARTTYAVTSDRIFINSGLFTPTTKSLNVKTLTYVTLHERPNGTGTITFGPVNPIAAMYSSFSWPGVPQTPSFEMIPDAKRVYGIIRESQQEQNRRTS